MPRAGLKALHAAYERLVERAAAAGLLPPAGLTPREQAAKLQMDDRLATDDIRRLRQLYEQCVFNQAESPEHVSEGVDLCGRLASALPEPVVGPSKRRRRWISGLAGFSRGFEAMAAAGPYLLIVAVTAVVIWLLIRLPWGSLVPRGGPSMRLAAPMSPDISFESVSAVAKAADASWKSAPAKPSWTRCTVPETLAARDAEHADWRPFDRDTGTDGYYPGAVDPFSPRLGWTHRRMVYDAVDSRFQPVNSVGEFRPATGERQPDSLVHGVDIEVDFAPYRPVPVPSSTPRCVVLDHAAPQHMTVRFMKDETDTLYAMSDAGGRVRLRYRLASSPDYRSGGLPDIPFEPRGTPLPENVRAEAEIVLEAIGGLPRISFRETVERLHAYFAGFTVSPLAGDEIRESDFLTIALARKGVCRHRARTFFITANAVGVETRLVENRTHSFCEIRLPGGGWRRMEFRLASEEGPPGLDRPADELASTTMAALEPAPGIPLTVDNAAMLLLPVVLLLLMGHLLLGSRHDRTGHLVRVGPRPTRFMRRSHRDEDDEVSPQRVMALAELTLMRLCSHLGVEPRQLWATLRADPVGWTSPLARARVRKLLILLQRRQEERIDAPEMQRLYWDCFNILERIHRLERP